MCYVTATELKKNLSYYLERSMTEDVYVTKNKKIIADVCFNVVKNIRLVDGREQVIPIDILYNECNGKEQQQKLMDDTRQVVSRFLQKHLDSIVIENEYKYKDLK